MEIDDEAASPMTEVPETSGTAGDAPVAEMSETEIPIGTAPDTEIAGPEMEVFYTFTWGGNRPPARGRSPTSRAARVGPAGQLPPQGRQAQGQGRPAARPRAAGQVFERSPGAQGPHRPRQSLRRSADGSEDKT